MQTNKQSLSVANHQGAGPLKKASWYEAKCAATHLVKNTSCPSGRQELIALPGRPRGTYKELPDLSSASGTSGEGREGGPNCDCYGLHTLSP